MKLAVVAANGRTANKVIDEAVKRGFDVTAFGRGEIPGTREVRVWNSRDRDSFSAGLHISGDAGHNHDGEARGAAGIQSAKTLRHTDR